MNLFLSSIKFSRVHNPKNWITLVLCFVNLAFVHYYILINYKLEISMSFPVYIDNFCGVIIDVACLMLILFFITKKHLNISLSICFWLTFGWSFANVLYSRFFATYITLSSIGQTKTIFDWLMFKCILHGISLIDFYYVFVALYYFMFCTPLDNSNITFRSIFKRVTVIVGFLIFINFFAHFCWCFTDVSRRYLTYYTDYLYKRHVGSDLFMCGSRFTFFSRGFIRTLICEYSINNGRPLSLNSLQNEQIEKSIKETNSSFVKRKGVHVDNVIFIIVESYMSFTSDLVLDGKEITPNLNNLKNSPNNYFNGRVNPNITIGESSDGQFIYMTGLLPLRSILTISKVGKMKHLPALPKVLKDSLGLETRMVIPTVTSMWNQDRMCRQYGIDNLYSSADYPLSHSGILNDKEVFELAKQLDNNSKRPFFSVILTMSMHQPYEKFIDPSFTINNELLTTEQKCYLNACHYTDTQIGNYIDFLKKKKIFDNSLIIIAADHHVNKVSLQGEECMECHQLPLYIINGDIPNNNSWHWVCQQLDVYPTILNVLGLTPKWRGLGYSLLNPNFQNSVTVGKWKSSEWIILGDYYR